ncbi:MAG: GTPase Era [Clostridiales bacterium]|nr:GTPase Era [Clostridiales bacterium]
MNKENRGIDKETDVLSFPMAETGNGELMEEPDPEFDEEGNKIFNLGDIIICPDVAIEHAEEYGHSNEREFAFLTAHSLLHLLGYDHMMKRDEKIMTRLQKMLMMKIGLAFDDEVYELNDHQDEATEDNIAYPAGSICSHCGYVSILGRPNVGKSTLINLITGMKVAIVSHKPQTTRTNIRAIYNTDDTQIIFTDTPGVHKPGSKLGKIMVGNSFASAKNSDVILLIADGRFKTPGDIEKQLIAKIKENNKKAVLAINKSDDITKEDLLPIISSYASLYDFSSIVPISAKTGDNVDVLLEELSKLLPEGPRMFDSEHMTDQTEREIAKELIREQLLHFTNQEVPHGIAVEIDQFEEKYDDNAKDEYDRDIIVIKASIICERSTHKGIILGKNGSMIKRIGTAARKNIERMTGCKVFLELFVKVREDWKNNDLMLNSFGYKSEDD